MSHGQILIAHQRLINPQAKAHAISYDLLGAVAKSARAHSGRWHFNAFLPQQPRLMASSQTAAAGEEIIRCAGGKPVRLLHLLPPEVQAASGFGDGVAQLTGNRRKASSG